MTKTASDVLIDTVAAWGLNVVFGVARRRHQWHHGGPAQASGHHPIYPGSP